MGLTEGRHIEAKQFKFKFELLTYVKCKINNDDQGVFADSKDSLIVSLC